MAETEKEKRMLDIYTRLLNGEVISKAEAAVRYGVNVKSIQRDIVDIRDYFDTKVTESGYVNEIVYDQNRKGYYLKRQEYSFLSKGEILAVCKILLDSRAFTRQEMQSMLDKLLDCCVPRKNREIVKDLVSNEIFHYVEPQHHTEFIDKMWEIGTAIRENRVIEITYTRRKDHVSVTRRLEPLAIMFSEYYFYLTAFIENINKKMFSVEDDPYPTIYRIDRIESLTITDEHYKIPYKDRFEEGEFRKRVQFMYGGKLRKIKFRYKGDAVEAILDRLPTAKILEADGEGMIISAEVFGDGIDMWLRSQGAYVELLGG